MIGRSWLKWCRAAVKARKHGQWRWPLPVCLFGRIPRIARLMAPAIRMQKLIDAGEAADHAKLAQLDHVTRTRITQIMNLLRLAPDIQEDILFLPPVESGRDPIRELELRPITRVLDWREQRPMWQKTKNTVAGLADSRISA